MGKQKKHDISELDGLTEVFNEAVQEFTHEVLWTIENMYETAIEAFYNDYTPLYYQRTGSTWYGSSGAETLFSSQNIKRVGENIWDVGIEVDPSFIPGEPYRANTDWVFARTFNKGIHGIYRGKVWGKKDKPKTYTKTVGKKVFETIYGQSVNGTSVVKKKKKYYEGNVRVVQSVMHNMNPTPRGMIGREFKEFKKKSNLDKMFFSILDSKLN